MKLHLVQAKDGTIELKPTDATGAEQDDGADVPIVTEDHQYPTSISGPTEKKPHHKDKKHPRKKHKKKKSKKKSSKDELSPKITDHATYLLEDGVSEKVNDGAAPPAQDGVVDNVTMSNDIIPAKAFLVEDTAEDDKATGSESEPDFMTMTSDGEIESDTVTMSNDSIPDKAFKGTGPNSDDSLGDFNSIKTAGSDDFAVTMSNDIIPAKAFLVEDTSEDDKGTDSDSDDSLRDLGDLNSTETAGSDDFAVEDLEAGTGPRNVASRPPSEHNTCCSNPCCQILSALGVLLFGWRVIVGIQAAADCAEHC
jgi:hypothetical protein